MKTKVTQTSLGAYAAIAPKIDEMTVRVASKILERTNSGLRSWISQLSRDIPMDKSSVSARLNALKKDGATVIIKNQEYRLIFCGYEKDPISRVKSETWNLVHAKAGQQLNLFQ